MLPVAFEKGYGLNPVFFWKRGVFYTNNAVFISRRRLQGEIRE
jgi:hypothetical protein